MPKISVVMPVYNTKEKYLREAIESILNQTYSDFEFIIINDGSTNNAEDVILSYKDKRIKYFKQENKGVANTLNYGFDIAQGEYIARMDSDDISLPNRFEKQIKFLEENKDIAILGSWHEEFHKQHIRKPSYEIKLLDLFRGNLVSHPTIMLRKNDLDKYQLRYDPSFTCEDYELWSRIARYLKFHNLQEVLLKYRRENKQGNVSSTLGVFMESEKRVRQNILDFLTNDVKLQNKIRLLFNFNREMEHKNTFWENIFSVQNTSDRKYKLICIFGIKLKIKRKILK